MTLIAPSILSADFAHLADAIHTIEDAGADWVHIDVMDGHFVPNITMGPVVVRNIRPHTKLFFDCHLMILHPEQYIQAFAEAGADLITIHIEADTDHKKTLEQIHNAGCKAGISINPDTPLSTILDMIDLIDNLLIMSVHPGFSGQSFIDITEKITEAKQLFSSKGKEYITIEVDGGINEHTAPLVVAAGADVLVAASYIFKSEDIKKAITILKES